MVAAVKPVIPASPDVSWATLVSGGLSALGGWLYSAAWIALAALVAWAVLKFVQRLIFFLGKDEQLVIVRLTDTEVHNGPGTKLVSPFVKSVLKRKGLLLEPLGYAKIKDVLTGELRVEVGPQLLFLGPYDEVVKNAVGESLNRTQYCVVLDKVTGVKRVERGPRVLVPGANEDVSSKKQAISLNSNQYCRVVDASTGRRWVVRGEALLFPEPTWEIVGGVRSAVSLKNVEYVRLIDETTGATRVERGEQMVFPEATESVLNDEGTLTAINLKIFEYVRVLDSATGVQRVIRGEATVFLGPTEEVIGGGKQTAVEVDTETAVRIRNKRSGELQLVTNAGLFFPKAEEEILEVQKLVKLADYECMMIKNASGELSFYYGDDAKRGDKPRAFFIPPHHTAHQLCWSRGRRRERRDLRLTTLDCRPQFMSFEFNCRTADNVELVLEGTFFWQVVDVQAMVKTTGDTTGDVCNHARSKFIQLVSKVTLKDFMDNFNGIAAKAHEADDAFYSSRGVQIHTLEVTAYRCQDDSTARILEQIIQETTNRMNRLSQQESENEIKMFAMDGQIEQETKRAELLKVLQTHKLMEAANEGEAEAARVKAFLAETQASVPELKQRVALWQTLRKQDALAAVSSGDARLYFTPNDVNLTIESKEA